MTLESNPKMLLPPITSMSSDLPVFQISINKDEPQEIEDSKSLKIKPSTFTTMEDISILKTMKMYFGNLVNPKIPWSFWQLYRRMTGSQRSDSSLYHHWNGSMMKKYGGFIREGRIDDCINWAESTFQLESRKINPENTQNRPLFHAKSMQNVPIQIYPHESNSPKTLLHFNSQIHTSLWK